MNLQPLRYAYGFALIALLTVHFGVYHSIYASLTGILWGFYLPIGYVGLLSGLMVMAYPVTRLRKFNFGSLMIIVGFALILTNLFTPRESIINLLNQTSLTAGQIDIDYPVGSWYVWILTLFSIAAGLMLRIGRQPRK